MKSVREVIENFGGFDNALKQKTADKQVEIILQEYKKLQNINKNLENNLSKNTELGHTFKDKLRSCTNNNNKLEKANKMARNTLKSQELILLDKDKKIKQLEKRIRKIESNWIVKIFCK